MSQREDLEEEEIGGNQSRQNMSLGLKVGGWNGIERAFQEKEGEMGVREHTRQFLDLQQASLAAVADTRV
jgi:hypothetical protein